jgi:MFS family permease
MIPQVTFFLINKGMEVYAKGGIQQGMSTGMVVGIIFSVLFAVVIMMILQFWAQGALIYAVSETYLGHETSIGRSYGAMRSRLWRLLSTMFLMGFLLVLAPVLLGIVAAIFIPPLTRMGYSGSTTGILFAVLWIAGAAWFLHLLLNWLLVDKVVVLEGEGWRSALRRSKELMKTRTEPGFWKRPKNKAALILFLGFLIGIGIHLLFQTPGLIMHWLMPSTTMGQTIQEILNVVATSLATVFTAIAMILFYYDIRLRSEGFDLKAMAEHL